MWIYSTIEEIIDVLFYSKRKCIGIVLVLLTTFVIWFALPQLYTYITGANRAGFIKTQDISLTRSTPEGQYGETATAYYFLLPQQYVTTNKTTECTELNAADFTTWCDVTVAEY